MTDGILLKILFIILITLVLAFLARKTSEKSAVVILLTGLILASVIFMAALFQGGDIPDQAEAALPDLESIGSSMLSGAEIETMIERAMSEDDPMKKFSMTLDVMIYKARNGELPGQETHRKGG